MSGLWRRQPSAEELEALQPWLQVHDFGEARTVVAAGAEGTPVFFRERSQVLGATLALLEPHVQDKTLFEFGSASGVHCFVAAGLGWKATGIDARELHIAQGEFIGSLLSQEVIPPRFVQATDRTLGGLEDVWDVGLCYAVLLYAATPTMFIDTLASKIRRALVLETPLYVPPNDVSFYSGGSNWLLRAPCVLSNHGAQPHNKKGIDSHGWILSLPALNYLLYQAGFDGVASVSVPGHWKESGSRGLAEFSSRRRGLLVAVKGKEAFASRGTPPEWTWLSPPGDTPNYDYHGPITQRDGTGAGHLRRGIGRRLIRLGQRLVGDGRGS